jgi:hypothetical protein
MFSEKVKNCVTGALFYGITPPKTRTEEDKLKIIAEKRTNRINELKSDALVIYDIQDESNRTDKVRPFKYFPTLDPLQYTDNYHCQVDCQKIIYHVPGKYSADEFTRRLIDANANNHLSVFVGAASKNQQTRIKLSDAYEIWNKLPNRTLLGGVVIPERHNNKRDEHLRIIDKQNKGCSFFVSQCICNIEMIKNFISDYCCTAEDQGLAKKYFVFTLTICGTAETLDLMNWLGIDIPKWFKNDLIRSKDLIEESIKQNLQIAQELFHYCNSKNLCCGFNIESVSPKKAEVDATVILFNELKKHMTYKDQFNLQGIALNPMFLQQPAQTPMM